MCRRHSFLPRYKNRNRDVFGNVALTFPSLASTRNWRSIEMVGVPDSSFCMNLFHHKTISALLAVFVLSGQTFASIPAVCGCSDSQPESSSCCSTEASTDSDCCCEQRCGVEQTACDCGCSDSGSKEEQAPVEESRLSGQSIIGRLPSASERFAVPGVPRQMFEGQTSGLVETTSPQILFCVWQT